MHKTSVSVIALAALGLAACEPADRTMAADQRDDAETTMAARDADPATGYAGAQDPAMQTQRTGDLAADRTYEDQDQPVVERVQDAAAEPVGIANAALRGGDTEAYVRNITLANMYETRAGEIAIERGQSAAVREMGQGIVDDHGELQASLDAAVSAGGVEVETPLQLDERRQGLIDNLRNAPAADFDAVFLRQQEAAHREALTWHEAYESRGDVEALRTAATEAKAVIERHLDSVRQHQEATGDGR